MVDAEINDILESFVECDIEKGEAFATDKIEKFTNLHPSDQAVIIDELLDDEEEKIPYLTSYLQEDAISYLEKIRDYYSIVGESVFSLQIAELDTYDAIRILNDLKKDDRKSVVASLPPNLISKFETSFTFEEDSVGRIMDTNFISIPYWFSSSKSLEVIKNSEQDKEDISDIIIVDEQSRPVAFVSVTTLLAADPKSRLKNISDRKIKTLFATSTRDDLIRFCNKYDPSIIPVVNKFGKLVGIINPSEVVEIISEEAQDDALKSRGILGKVNQGLITTSLYRSVWLFINLITAVVASFVISIFEEDFRIVTSLAVLMPIVASMGGNAGMQSVTVTVRLLSLKDLNLRAYFKHAWVEFCISLLNSIMIATVAGLAVFIWYKDPTLALLFFTSVAITLINAGVFGSIIPFVIHRIKLDPAISSAIILTTATDVVGFGSFLLLAHFYL